MTWLLLVVYVLSVHRFTRLVVSDSITQPIRDRALARWPSEDTVFTAQWVTHTSGEPATLAGVELYQIDRDTWGPLRPHWFGELITCPWCASVWIAALVLPFFWLWPDLFTWLGLIPAASSVSGLLSRVE